MKLVKCHTCKGKGVVKVPTGTPRPFGCVCRRSWSTDLKLIAHVNAGCKAYDKWARSQQ